MIDCKKSFFEHFLIFGELPPITFSYKAHKTQLRCIFNNNRDANKLLLDFHSLTSSIYILIKGGSISKEAGGHADLLRVLRSSGENDDAEETLPGSALSHHWAAVNPTQLAFHEIA